MLELKGISKSYTTGEFTQHALKNINLKFRKSEFVAILGPSGSGKTTMLNIVGGLDRYDKGDLIIIEGVEKVGLGLAIMNRLIRTSDFHYIEL